MKKTLKLLKLTYYSVYLAAIIAAFSGYTFFKNGLTIDSKSDAGVTLQSILILFIIGSIPLTLAAFNRMTKKWAEIDNTDEKIKKYQEAGILRIVIIGLGLIVGVVFYYVMQSQSMIFAAGIATIALFFCRPSENKIIIDLKLDENPNE